MTFEKLINLLLHPSAPNLVKIGRLLIEKLRAKQTNQQTNTFDYNTTLAEVTMPHVEALSQGRSMDQSGSNVLSITLTPLVTSDEHKPVCVSNNRVPR